MTTTVECEFAIKAPLEAVWGKVADFGSLKEWVVNGDQSNMTTTGEGVGMVRDFWLPGMGNVQHRLEELDEAAHRMTYSLTKGHPLGMADYSISVTLTPREGGGTLVSWKGWFTADDGADLDAMAERLKSAYEDMSVRLDALLTG